MNRGVVSWERCKRSGFCASRYFYSSPLGWGFARIRYAHNSMVFYAYFFNCVLWPPRTLTLNWPAWVEQNSLSLSISSSHRCLIAVLLFSTLGPAFRITQGFQPVFPKERVRIQGIRAISSSHRSDLSSWRVILELHAVAHAGISVPHCCAQCSFWSAERQQHPERNSQIRVAKDIKEDRILVCWPLVDYAWFEARHTMPHLGFIENLTRLDSPAIIGPSSETSCEGLWLSLRPTLWPVLPLHAFCACMSSVLNAYVRLGWISFSLPCALKKANNKQVTTRLFSIAYSSKDVWKAPETNGGIRHSQIEPNSRNAKRPQGAGTESPTIRAWKRITTHSTPTPNCSHLPLPPQILRIPYSSGLTNW